MSRISLKKGDRLSATTGPSTTTADQAAFGAEINSFSYSITFFSTY
jgi:hypothetical protein